MNFLIVGLGNVGEKYDNTRHNIGFDVLDQLAKEQECTFDLQRLAFKTSFKGKGKTFHLIKPTTYMNLSGKAVRYWMQQLKIPIERVLVIVDDLDIDFGKLRIRSKGSAGSHNGLGSIQEVLAATNYPRLRFGIGSNFSRGRQVEFVLGEWSAKEKEELWEPIDNACKAIISFGTAGLSRTMNTFNKK